MSFRLEATVIYGRFKNKSAVKHASADIAKLIVCEGVQHPFYFGLYFNCTLPNCQQTIDFILMQFLPSAVP